MAEMSPICSIMEAMAMGAITRMEVISNLAMTNFCRPTRLAELTLLKLIRGTTLPAVSTAVAPKALAIRATI